MAQQTIQPAEEQDAAGVTISRRTAVEIYETLRDAESALALRASTRDPEQARNQRALEKTRNAAEMMRQRLL